MRALLAVVLCATVPALASCGDDSGDTIALFAAASLTEAFTEIGTAFEAAHPDVSVEASFAGSSSLREQILQGAPADVFASANISNMDQVVAAAIVDDAVTFATNRLQIVVPAGNPGRVRDLDAFADEDLLIGLCAEEVPCGDFARRVLAGAGVTPSPDTNEPDVRSLLTKVEAGELDAGIVYVTDVVAAGDGVEGIDIPDDSNVVASYPIGVLADAGKPGLATSFVEFVLGDEGQAILREHGFGRP